MSKIDIIVTRHEALLQYLLQEGIVKEGVKVVSHAAPDTITGKHVLGVLPHALSSMCASFTEVPLFLPPELRGKELTLAEVTEYAGEPVTYSVTRHE